MQSQKNKQNKKFYNADEIMSRHYALMMICGDRSAGKTTCIQRHIIRKAIKKNEQFCIIVRYDKDHKELCETYFDNTMDMFYKDYILEYKTKKFYLSKKTNPNDKKLVGYCFALNMATKKKSTSYPYITTMLFEEFTNIEDKYIRNQNNPELEVELLLSLYSTIARGGGKQLRDNVRIFMISNNYYLNNPYFRYFRLIDKIVSNPFKRFYTTDNPRAILEVTHNQNELKYEMARDDTMMASNFTDLRNELNIAKNITNKKIILQLTIDNKIFYSLANFNETLLFYKDKKKDKELIFSCSDIKKKDIMSIVTLKRQCSDIYNNILNHFNNNWLYYDSVETYIAIYNIFSYTI